MSFSQSPSNWPENAVSSSFEMHLGLDHLHDLYPGLSRDLPGLIIGPAAATDTAASESQLKPDPGHIHLCSDLRLALVQGKSPK